MANTFDISRANLIYGICLPLAVLIGYLLAEPLESGNLAVMMLVICVLAIPAMMRWRQSLLVFSCNCAMAPLFLPGHPALWMVMVVINLFFNLLSRSLGRDINFFRVRSLSYALIALALVALITAKFTGGIGFSTLGSAQAGGRKYFDLLMGIMLYFVMSTVEINPKRAGWYMGLFFLPALIGLIGYLGLMGGPAFYILGEIFPVASEMQEAGSGMGLTGTGMTRIGSLSGPAVGLFCFLMARYGVRGLLDLTRPWRLALFALTLVGALCSGFRSQIITFAMTFMAMFYLEGLFRTRHFPVMIFVGLLGVAILLPNAQRLPLVAQRALSFLPLNIDPAVRDNAEGSTDWRLEMWKELMPTVPKYLLKGKGYAVDANDMYLAQQSTARGQVNSYEAAALAGDYHSGPLSVIIPFGLYGVVAFTWFLVAGGVFLYRNYLYGDVELRLINSFLLAYFWVRVFNFIFVFGSLHSDTTFFCGLLGLGVCLNGGTAAPPQPESPQPELLEVTEYEAVGE